MFEGLEKFDDESINKFIGALLDDKNVDTKTEIENPLNMARLMGIAEWLEAYEMYKPAKFLRAFIKSYNTYMISRDRKSRQEVVSVLSEAMKEERRMRDKLSSEAED